MVPKRREIPGIQLKTFKTSILLQVGGREGILSDFTHIFLEVERGALEEGAQQLVWVPRHRVRPAVNRSVVGRVVEIIGDQVFTRVELC